MNKQLFIIHDVYNLNTQPNIQTHFEQKMYANFGENYADASGVFQLRKPPPFRYLGVKGGGFLNNRGFLKNQSLK